jgi:hypothetical protein
MDKLTDMLLEALKRAIAVTNEQRLYKSGKLDGLFPARSGASAEAAARALNDGLLDLVRTETKGKTTIEWVRITPKGINWLHDQESPVQVLRELRQTLETTRTGMPNWLAELRQELQTSGNRLMEKAGGHLQRLDALSRRVEEALKRADLAEPQLPDGLAASVPWGIEALTYLKRRCSNGGARECPLPELFAAVREKHSDLSLTAFHDGLRRLSDRHALRLSPPVDPAQPLPEPEHAILDGAAVFYYASMSKD